MKSLARFAAFLSVLAFGLFVPQAESQTKLSNTWSSTGQLTQARSGSAAIQLIDGRILITGGTDSNGVPQATAEVYDPTTGAFSALPSMNVPRANHATTILLTGDVLVTGGLTSGGGYSDSAEIYSVSSNTWTLVPNSMSTGVAGHTMVLLSDGNVLIAGGTSTAKVVSSIILFKRSDQTFTLIGSLLTPRTNAVAAGTPDGRVLIAGGADINGAALASTEIFTYSKATMTGTIAAGPTMSSARVYATATTTYDGVAVIGGNNGNNDLGTAEIFSQWTNAFTVVKGGTPRSHHFAALLPKNGSILAMGGTGGPKVDLLEPWANKKAGAFIAAADSLDNQDGGFGAPAGLGSLLAAGGTGDAASAAELYWFPTVSTQNPEYAPGTTVDMSGAGFEPYEPIDLHIHVWVDQTTEDLPDATITANALGDFSYDGYSPDQGDIGARYHLTAVGKTSGYQAQTIFGDSISSIDFANAPLNQATGACGELIVTVGGSAPYGTLYLYTTSGTGTFYTSATCTGTAITSITAAASVTLYYKDTTAGTPELTACSAADGSGDACELAQAFGLAELGDQTEDIYGAATKLAWSTLPGNGGPSGPLAQQPVVEVQDASGDLVAASTASITLTLSGGGGGGTLTCNTNPVTANSGLAQFSGCTISPASTTQYCLVASSTGLTSTGASAACFYISNSADAGDSTVISSVVPPATVLDNGVATATITVTLKDSSGTPVPSKTVTLSQGTGTNSTISAASGVSSAAGVVTFTVSDAHAETVTYTATDVTDGIVVAETAQVIFAAGAVSTTRSTVTASPTNVTADGVSYSTITVTLEDSSGDAVSGKAVTLAATACTTACTPTTGNSVITEVNATTNSSGQATFQVVDATVQNVTYTATDTTDSINLTTHTVTVDFLTSGTAVALTFTTTPPTTEPNNGTFSIAATSNGGANDHGAITYSVSGVCTLLGTTVTMTAGTGTCTVTVTQAAYHYTTGAGAYYNSALLTATVTAGLAAPTSLTVTGAPASAAYNTSFTVSSTTVVPTGGATDTGAVTFSVGSSTACSDASGGNTILMTAGTGTCSITATQAADSNYNSITSAAVTVSATPATATVAVTCPTGAVYDGSAFGTAGACTAMTTPSGLTVDLTYNGSATQPINAGSYTVVGTIDTTSQSNYTGTSTSQTFVISPEPVTAVAGSFSTAYTGSVIPVPDCQLTGNFTANLTCVDNPTGETEVGTGVVAPVVTYGTDVAANYTINAVNGTWTITQNSSSVALTCAPGTFAYTGAAITPCVATVTAPGPTLTATIQYANNIEVGTAAAVATFVGNTDVTSSSSALVTFAITAQPAIITLGPTLAFAYTGSQIPVAVTTTPTGLAYTETYAGIAPTVYAQSSTPPINPGSYTVVATITDPNYVGTATATETIGPVSPQMILSLDGGSSNPSLYGTAVSFDLNVNNGAAPAPCPTGSVQFYVNGVLFATVPVPASCASSLFYQIATLPEGANTVYAIYSGDSNYASDVPSDTSNTLTQNVSADATGVSLTILPGTTINVGGAITFTATITPNPAIDSGASGPGGTVSFYECVSTATTCNSSNGTLVGTAQPVSATTPYTAQLVNPTLAAGTWAIGAVYTSSDSEFSGSSSTVLLTVTVNINDPNIIWATPDPIVYGTALSSTQLDAQAQDPNTNADITGAYVYSPVSGTVPAAGSLPLNVTFTPTDTSTYSPQSGSVTLFVTPATLTVTANNNTMPFGGPVPTNLTYTIAGCVNGDSCDPASNPVWGTGTAMCSTTATVTSPIGGYPITCAIGTLAASNYTFTFVPGIMQVTAGTTLTIATPPTASNITFGQTLASSVLTGGSATYGGTAVPGTFAWTTPTTAPGGGTSSYSVTFTASSSNYSNMPTTMVSVTVTKADPTIATEPTAAPISVGQALSASGLTGGTVTFNSNPVLGTFAWTNPTTAPPVGTASYSVTFTPNDTTDYNTVTGTVSLTVNSKQTPTIATPPAASAISYGQALSASTLNPVTAVVPTNASVAGTFAWTTPATVPVAGADPESITFTPTDTTDYNAATGSVTITVNKATPTIGTPPVSTAISVGQTLAGSTLTGGSATNPNGGAAVAGTFAWTTPATVPPAGTASYSVTFTPTDAADFNTATVNVSLTVNNKTTPTITTLPTASSIIYGQTLAQSTLTGGLGSVAGTFAWTTPATVPGAGTPSESVTFTPTDTTDYNTATGSVTLTVSKATPTITTPPTASAISVGQALSASTLNGGAATLNSNPVPGGFAWTTPTTIPGAGTPSESVTFTPTDPTDFNTVILTVTVAVNNKTTPTVTVWPTASAITYGQTLASSTLTPVTAAVPGNASVAGTFTWTNPTTAPGAGTPSESVTFTPTDTTDYNTVANTITITVNKATPTITAPPTASFLSVGQALSASTLAGGTATSGATPVPGGFAWTTPTTVPPLGADPESVTFTPTDTTDYTTATVSVTVTVNSKTTPTITTLPTASSIIYGQTLAASVLAGGVGSVPGSFAWTTPSTVPGAGTPSESIIFTPTDTTDYNTVTTTVTLTVSKATPTVSVVPVATAISSGQALSSSTLTGGTAISNATAVPGSFAWTTPATVPPVGADVESVTFTPTDTTDFNTATATVTVTVNNKTTPTITTLPLASAITYGQTLASSTLTGGTGSVAGSFAWTTPTTAPGAGTPSENVTFTPTDTTDYNTTTGTVTLTVNKATPTVTVLPTASPLSIGQTLASSTLNGGTASVPGSFAWTTPTTAPPLGADPESVTFTPTDATDYNTATATVTVTVNSKATPTITTLPTASSIIYGQTLAASVLSGGSGSVAGTFSWTTPATVPGAGTPSESVTFTPSDTTDYNSATGTVTLTVSKATPTITTPPIASAISSGQALAASTLAGGVASVPGSFAWTTPATIPPVGADVEGVTFTPTDTTDYNSVTTTVTVTVNNKITPTITTLPAASPITYGQALSASTLTGGTGSVAGTFAWTNPAAVPGAGADPESVTFTPTDTTDYNTASGTVTVTVNKATPTVTVLPIASTLSVGQTLASSNLTGGTASVPGTFAWATPTTAPPLGADPESVIFTPTDTTDYNTATTTVTVTVNSKNTPTITTLPSASAIIYGQSLAASVLSGGSGSVAGSFAWTTPTTTPPTGADPESVTFTPTDTTDNNTATGTVTVTVNKATPTVTVWPTAAAISVGQTLASSALAGGTASVPGLFAWTTPTTAPALGTTSESVTFTPTDATDYNTVAGTVSVTVNNKTAPTITTLPTAGAITYGQTLTSSALTGGTASVAGTFAWTTPTIAPGAGADPESITFTPTNTTLYDTVAGTVTVTVNKATPTVTVLPTAAALSVGQALSASVLTGGTASAGATPVPGTFAWTAPGTIPVAGADPESVTFTPTDTTDYNTATANVTVTVGNLKTPTITTLPTASSIVYGQTLASSVLTGGKGSVAGTFAWTDPTTAPTAGADPEGVTFTPTDTTDYNTVAGTVTVTVTKVTPTVTAWPTASAIAPGKTLASSTLTGGTATYNGNPVPGTFAWTTPTIAPAAGSDVESVTFTPTDATDYNTVIGPVTVLVNNKTTPTVTTWPTASAITFGQTLAASTLTGGTASVAGTFAWTTPTTAPIVGADVESVTFTPTDTTDYNTVTGSVTVTVSVGNKTTPTVTKWPTAGVIYIGQTLASSVLTGGTASVAGTFDWTTPTIAPPVGADAEGVTFTPTDTTSYNTVAGSVTVTVNSGTRVLTVSADSQSRTYGAANPALTYAITGFVSGDTIAVVSGKAACTTTAAPASAVGKYPITCTQGTLSATNYTFQFNNSGSVTVTAAPLALVANDVSRVYGDANPAFTGKVTGAVNGDTFTESFTTSATTSSKVGTYPIDPSVKGTNLADYVPTAQEGALSITQADTTTTVKPSSSSVNPGQSVTLTAKVVSATTGTPTGSVSFYEGTNLLGTGTLASGTAEISTTSLTAGATNSIEAVYSGDDNFTTSVSSASVSEASLDFSLAISGAASATVNQGSAATYQVAVKPLYGSYPGSVSFAAVGAPSSATVTFSPSTIAANAGSTTVTVTIKTSGSASLVPADTGTKRSPLAWALVLIPLLGFSRLRRQGRRLNRLATLLLLLGCTLAGALVTGCGSSVSLIEHDYSVVVTATSGNVIHNIPVTLDVQ